MTFSRNRKPVLALRMKRVREIDLKLYENAKPSHKLTTKSMKLRTLPLLPVIANPEPRVSRQRGSQPFYSETTALCVDVQ
jgi:hypothetical protein